jgi:hypothetical protein
MFNAYPAKRYHATEAPCYVQNADEAALLGPGWFDDPTKAALSLTTVFLQELCDATQDDATCQRLQNHRGPHKFR